MKTHVAMTVSSKRPELLVETLRSWEAVRLPHPSTTTFSHHLEPNKAEQVCADLIRNRHQYDIWHNSEVLGISENTRRALQHAWDNCEAELVIITEEDVLVSDDVLEMFSWAAVELAPHKDRILATCAYNSQNPRKVAHEDTHTLELTDWFSPTCWATWASNVPLLLSTWEAHPHGHDYSIDLMMISNKLLIANPILTRAQHIGLTGEHVTPEFNKRYVHSEVWRPHIPPGHFSMNGVTHRRA